MDRCQEMKEFLLPYRVKWLNERMEGIQEDTSSSIKNDLLPILQEMIKQVIQMQEEGNANDIVYLMVCYLRSSMITGSHDYLVMLSDQALYLDDRRVERYWCPKQLYSGEAEDILSAQKEIKNKFIRVSEYEKNYVRQLVEEEYFSFLEVGLSKELPQIQEWEIFRHMKKERGFQCVYGEYMGDLKKL